MKFSLLALPAFVAGATANLDEIRAKRRLNQEFMRAMTSDPRISEVQKKKRAQKVRKLHEDLIKASRKLSSSQYSEYQQQAYSDQQQYYQQQQQYQQDGQYQYQQQYQQDDQYQYQQNGQGNQYQQNAQGNQYQYQEGQTYSDQGTWNGEYWEFNGEIPFDLSSRAFKYSGCAAIKTYDSDRAYSNGNPMVMDTYATFRLCPADKCNDYSMTGCGKNYGEYAIEMKTYLSYVLGFYDGRFQDYCNYCEPCDYEYEALAKTALQQCYADLEQTTYANAQKQQQQAWQEYYNANNGDMSGWNVNGDGNFQNYNNYYNQAHNYDGYYNIGGSNGAYGSGANQYGGSYKNYNGNYRNGYGNRDLGNGYSNYGGYWGSDGTYHESNDDQYTGIKYSKCLDGSLCDECEYQNELEYLWCDDYTCGDYYKYCSELYGGEQNDFDVSQFLECAEYVDEYDRTYYIGPHCGSDHFTISLGVFSDENCVDYIGEDMSVAAVLGSNYKDADMFGLPKECISCDAAEAYENTVSSGEGRYGDYVTAPETDQEGTVAVCRALYSGSAQCNMNMNNFEQISRYMSTYEIDLEKRYCAFIANIIDGNYDENGDILLKPEQFNFADWKNPRQYKKLRMPADQAIYLSLSIIAFIATAAMAVFAHRSIRRSASPWRPKRGSPEEHIARKNSGIGFARSQSGPGNAPLI